MFSFYKKKNFRKIYILLGISITLFLCLFLNQNLSIKNVAVDTNKDLFSRKLLDDYNSFFEIKKITLNGRSKSNLDSIKNIVNSSLDKNKNISETYKSFFELKCLKIKISQNSLVACQKKNPSQNLTSTILKI